MDKAEHLLGIITVDETATFSCKLIACLEKLACPTADMTNWRSDHAPVVWALLCTGPLRQLCSWLWTCVGHVRIPLHDDSLDCLDYELPLSESFKFRLSNLLVL